MLRLWALREPWLKACWCVAQGASITDDAVGFVPSLLNHDALRLASFGGRDDMPRSLASVTAATITWFLGGVMQHVHSVREPIPCVRDVAILPGGATAVVVAKSGVFVFRLIDGTIFKKLPFKDAKGVCVTPRGAVYVACLSGVFCLDSDDFLPTGSLHGHAFYCPQSVSADDSVAVVMDGCCRAVVFENSCFVSRSRPHKQEWGRAFVVPGHRCFALCHYSHRDFDDMDDMWIPRVDYEIHVMSLTNERMRCIRIDLDYLEDFTFLSSGECVLVFGDYTLRLDSDATHVVEPPQHAISSGLRTRDRWHCGHNLVRAGLRHDGLHVISMH
jgi:hypothetical protein